MAASIATNQIVKVLNMAIAFTADEVVTSVSGISKKEAAVLWGNIDIYIKKLENK